MFSNKIQGIRTLSAGLCFGLIVAGNVQAFDLFKLKRPDSDKKEEQLEQEVQAEANEEQANAVSGTEQGNVRVDGRALTERELADLPVAKTYPVDRVDNYPRWTNAAPPPPKQESASQEQTSERGEPTTQKTVAEEVKQRYKLDENGFLVPVEQETATTQNLNTQQNQANEGAADTDRPSSRFIAPISKPDAEYVAGPAEQVQDTEAEVDAAVEGAPQSPQVQRPSSLFIAPTEQEKAAMAAQGDELPFEAPEELEPLMPSQAGSESQPNSESQAGAPSQQGSSPDEFTAPVFSEEAGYEDVVDPSQQSSHSGNNGVASFGSESFDNRAVIKARLEASRPDVKVRTISESPIAGTYRVEFQGGLIAHVTADARYFILGDLFKVDPAQGFVNLGEQYRRELRVQELVSIPADETVNYAALGADYKGRIYVFTDGECGACRRFHQEVPKLMEMGVEVRYLAFPRGYPRHGKLDRGYQSMVSVWCADEPEAAMDELNTGTTIPNNSCAVHPISEQYTLGTRLGVKTTPAFITESGQMLSGFITAERLADIVSTKDIGL